MGFTSNFYKKPMLRVLDSIVTLHDMHLVVLAVLLCLFACGTAMTMLARVRDNTGYVAFAWVGAAGLVAGCGVWATHFVAMLAFNPGFPLAYDVSDTILSVIVAAVLCATGFAIALQRSNKFFNAPLMGGAVAGVAVAAMHYIGMKGVIAPATLVWDAGLIEASWAISVICTAIAFWIAFLKHHWRYYTAGAVLFAFAICAEHFTGMAAETFHFDANIIVTNGIVSRLAMAMAVTSCASLILALGCAGAIFDYHLAERNRGEARRLRAYVTELENTRTNLVAAGKKLKVALATAASASKAKSEFLASMSHELRTPLNAIIGFSEVMTVETFGPLGSSRYKEYSSDIHDSGQHLLALINDILDLSRLDAGALALHEEDFNLHDVIIQALKMISRAAATKKVKLIEKIPAQLPAVRADERRMKQVMINLLANAIKFTPAGGSITVNAWVDDKGLSISVADTGVGIAPEDIGRALEPFSQVDSSVAREHGGAGLGLTLSKELMQLHGGALTLESQVSVGTTVTVTLPQNRLLPVQALSAAE